jgi:hypothetical protein
LGTSLIWLVIPIALAVAALIGVLAFLLRRRMSPRRAVLIAWGVASGGAGFLYRPRRRWETAPEYAASVAAENSGAGSMTELARLYSRARFADPNVSVRPPERLKRRTAGVLFGLLRTRLLPRPRRDRR